MDTTWASAASPPPGGAAPVHFLSPAGEMCHTSSSGRVSSKPTRKHTHIAFSKWKLLEEDWPFKQASPVSEERRKRSIMMLGKKDKFDEPMNWGPAQT